MCHTSCMRIQTTLYISAETPVHACDARVKVLLLLAFTIAVFFVETWWGMAVMVAIVVALVALANLPFKRLAVLSIPLFVLAGFTVLFNVVNAMNAGAFWASLSQGLLIGVRMILLLLASFIVCFTSTSTELVDAFARLMAPLRALHAPVDDVALVLSMAIRFIPLIAEEYLRIRDAQACRAASFETGPIAGRIKAQGAVFIPLFVSLFRRADSIALAMDARCYGYAAQNCAAERTSLNGRRPMGFASAFALCGGVLLLALLALLA